MSSRDARDRSVGPLLAAAVCCIGFIVSYRLGSGLTVFADEWNVILRPDWSADSLLEPLNEHIYLGPVIVYKLLLGIFGLDSTAPFRAAGLLLVVVIAALVFVFVRRRLGDAIGLIAILVLLLLGPAWEDLLWGAGISFLGAIAAGLGAFVCLERETRRTDVWACVLLVVSLAFSSLGLVFAIGAVVDVALRPDRLSRAWIPAIPFVLYAIWYAAYGHEAESALSADNLFGAPLYVADSAGSAIASLLGLTGVGPGSLGVNPDFGRPLLIVALALAVWAVALDRTVLSRGFWVLMASALAFWGSAALNQIPGREAGASRYQLIGAVFVVLIAAELLRGRRLSRGWLVVAGVVAAGAILSNLGALREGERFFREKSDTNIAALAALEGARDSIDPARVITPGFAGTPFPQSVMVSDYFDAVDRWGSPAADYRSLVLGTQRGREAADGLLAGAFGLQLSPGGRPAAAPGCSRVGPAADEVELPPGGGRLSADGIADVRLRRWAERATVDLGRADPGSYSLEIPTDDFDQPWTLDLRGADSASVCPL